MIQYKHIRVLSAPADREALSPVLEQLRAKGLRVSETEEAPGKNDLVLAVLSRSFYADEALTHRLLGLVGAGAENLLPLRLDAEPVPEALMNALYARNIIPAQGRDAALLAERIVAALPQKKSRLPLLLTAGAVVLAAVAGLLIWRAAQPKEEPVPVMAEATPLPLNLPAGLTAEDLAEIQAVVIVGDRAEFYSGRDLRDRGDHVDFDEFANRDFDRSGAHFYSKDDGHEYSMTRYEDLTYLSLMPNLRFLDMSLVEVPSEGLPDLSGAKRLENVMLMDSNIPDLRWLSGSPVWSVHVLNTTGSVRDFSPLTACRKLTEVHIDLNRVSRADLSGFCPPQLQFLWINGDGDLRGELDLADLRNSTRLQKVELQNLPLTDLSFLAEAGALWQVCLSGLHRLRDISALGGKASLRDVEVWDCDEIADFSPLAACTALQRFRYRTEGQGVFRDATFLSELPYITTVELENVDLRDLEFLRSIGERRNSINLNITGNVADYSGLEAVRGFGKLTLDPGDDTPLDRILPYLADTPIRDLELRRFDEVDLSALPALTERLGLDRCGIEDLSSMPEQWGASVLNLNKCSRLRSLEGLQNQSKLGNHGVGSLEIELCPRLTDWSALEGMELSYLEILGGATLPDFAGFHAGKVRLDSVGDVADLSFLDGADADLAWSFALLGLDVNNLAPLSRFHGNDLTVTPQLAEQAWDLVKAGNFHEYRVEYPEGAWELENEGFVLLSLDELETLPPALLRRVTEVCIAGDRVVDPDRFELWEDWSRPDRNGNPALMLRDRETDEKEPLGPGVVEDMSFLASLTGLKRLFLYGQPLKTLDGIQEFSSLEEFSAKGCAALTDASALFTLQQLEDAELPFTAVDSIQGVQNLPQLRRLNISHTKVTDLTPLGECDLSYAYECGGLGLQINEIEISEENAAALGTVARYTDLAFTNADPAVWIPALANCEIGFFGASGDLRTNEDLATLAADHPELRGLWLGWAGDVTDLTPLLALENLEHVTIDRDKTEAIASLDGTNHRFEFQING